MRRYFGIIIISLIVLGVIIALSAAGSIELDRPKESESQPIRSSYSTGQTGTRAFYQLLEESGRPVARWRDNYFKLERKAKEDLLIVIGPFQWGSIISPDEALALQKWVSEGGTVLIVSRYPVEQFGDPVIHSKIIVKNPMWKGPPESLIDTAGDVYIQQPTDITKNLRGLALSFLATRMNFYPPERDLPFDEESQKAPTPGSARSTPSPERANEEDYTRILYAPVIHLGDKDGAILADFKYGKGRAVFLSDPFVVANNGIARGGNLTLALNLIDSLTNKNLARRIFFDEFHHGYQAESNPLVNYFRGTPMPWLIIQGLILSLLIVYTYGKRFSRPLPLPQVDRHSPLEFVSSMANLQQVAQARDLAIENIYPRFKTSLCRRLGLSSRAQTDEIVAGLRRQRLSMLENEVRQVISESELVLKGEQIDDGNLAKIVGRMRRIMAQING